MQMEYEISKILQDYWNKLITKKQLHKYLKNYGYDKEQIKYLLKG